MFRKRFWLRPIIALLIVSLLPVANLAGFALQPAGAQGMEPIVLLEDESEVDGDEVTLVFAMTDPSYVPEVDVLMYMEDIMPVSTDRYDFKYDDDDEVYVFEAWGLESGQHTLYLNLIKDGIAELTLPFFFSPSPTSNRSPFIFSDRRIRSISSSIMKSRKNRSSRGLSLRRATVTGRIRSLPIRTSNSPCPPTAT